MTSNPLKIVDITTVDVLTGDELLDAATKQGFLFVEGHGFTQGEVDKLFAVSQEFFALSPEYKEKYAMHNSNHGYAGIGIENLDPELQKTGDPKEALNIGFLNFLTGISSQEIPGWFMEDKERYELVTSSIKKLFDLSIKILRILAIGLRIDGNLGIEWFTDKYDPLKASGSIFRFLHYPSQNSLNPEALIRAGAHSDYGSMTLLIQKENQEGLEIYTEKQWKPVPYISASENFPGMAPPLIVNIADQLSYWTSGLLKSTIHRVRFPAKVQESGQDRYSIVFFSHPNDETVLVPVPSPLTNGGRGVSKGNLITAKQHLDKRLAATYGKN